MENPKVLSIKTVLFSFSKNLPDIHDRCVKLFPSTFPGVDFKSGATTQDLTQLVSEKKPAVMIFHISGGEELQEILTLLNLHRNEVRNRTITIAIITKVYSQKIETTLRKAGAIEVLPYEIPQKALFHKLKRYISNLIDPTHVEQKSSKEETKIVHSQILSNEGSADEEAQKTFAEESQKYNGKPLLNVNPDILLVDPIDHAFDYWLIRKIDHIKRYKGMWLIELIGPSPAAGKWVESKPHQEALGIEDTVWEWTYRENCERHSPAFKTVPASWVFVGKRPEYDWSVNRWGFVSDAPALHLLNDGLIEVTRFSENDDGVLEIAENSKAGKKWFKKIKETFDREYHEQIDPNAKKEPAPDLPQIDQLDTMDVPPAAWSKHDLTKMEGPEWDEATAPPESDDMIPEDEFDQDMNIPLGASAMKDCGIHAVFKGEEIELMSYSENQPIILVGTKIEVKLKDHVEIDISSDNLSDEMSFGLHGFVTGVEVDGMGRFLITVILQEESHKKIARIRIAIEKRQQEIFEFFKRTKGIG
jgi:hypothetical protein